MSETFSKVEVITGVARRRRFTTEQKLLVVNETLQPGMSISYVARRHGLSPSLIFRWRRLMSEGGKEAVRADEDVVAASEVRRLEERVRDLERSLGRKTLEVEILKEALDLAIFRRRPRRCGMMTKVHTWPRSLAVVTISLRTMMSVSAMMGTGRNRPLARSKTGH
nr:transposase [Bradyrhizobium sp. 6(2017)]